MMNFRRNVWVNNPYLLGFFVNRYICYSIWASDFCRSAKGSYVAHSGGLCLKSMAIGTRSIAGSVDGAMRVSLRHSMNIFTLRVKSQRFSWILQSCGLTPVLLGPRKKRRTSRSRPRTDARRFHNETSSVAER